MKVKSQELKTWRFYALLAVFCLSGLALVWHLASVQVLPGNDRGFEFLQGQGEARTLRKEKMPAYRGVVSDRHGEPMAVSTPVSSIWAHPAELLAAKKQWKPLLKALSITRSELEKKLYNFRTKEFMYLRRHLSPEAAARITELAVPGIYEELEYKRFYPMGEVAAHVVGFTNIDDEGQEGIELAYNEWLTGTEGAKQVLKDLKGRRVRDVGLLAKPMPGKDVQLSIDMRLQFLAYRALKAGVKKHGAKAGSIVMLDARTGEVLAMANQPSFNPNNRRNASISSMRNRAITDQFEPGSTMKPLTLMAALEAGIVDETTQIDTNPGYFRVGRKTLLDHINYGVVDLKKIIQKSSQVGLTKISLQLEGDRIRDMYFNLGLGQSTGIGFPGESVGVLPNYPKWAPIVQANFSFGYGMTSTTLQLAQVYAAIANRGVKTPVTMLKTDKPLSRTQVIKPEVAYAMTQMLKTVVKKGGTATRADLKGYAVAGKTGTIHKAVAGGYADDRYVSLFAGFAPADDPRIIAVVMVDEPSSGDYFGGKVAAPVFAEAVDGALRLMQVPPANTLTSLAQLWQAEEGE